MSGPTRNKKKAAAQAEQKARESRRRKPRSAEGEGAERFGDARFGASAEPRKRTDGAFGKRPGATKAKPARATSAKEAPLRAGPAKPKARAVRRDNGKDKPKRPTRSAAKPDTRRAPKGYLGKPRAGESKAYVRPEQARRPGDKRAGERRPEADKPRIADARALGGELRATGKRKFYPTRGADDSETAPVRSLPRVPVPLSQLSSKEPHPGMWIFTTREGSEQDLVDELVLAKVVDPAPRVIGPALVLSPKLPKREGRPIDLTFARQGFEILQAINSLDLDEKTRRIVSSLRKQLADQRQYALHVWVPDSTEANPLASLADELDTRIEAELSRALPELTRIDDATLRRASVKFAQVCVLDTERAVAGVMHANRTPSLAKGGRTRVRITGDFPSRAARKIEEALAWLGVAPGPGEVCVDLGAAPGGWTYMLLERRARVIAVDPAKLRPDIAARKNVRHVMESAFTFTPDEHVDWLFCDMAWRPLEAAALLAKWGRRHWARIMVANIKLPMTKKAEILARVRTILEVEGEWKHVKAKQLYHDREEITLTAVRA